MHDLLVTGISELATCTADRDLGLLHDAAVAFTGGTVSYVGDATGAPDARVVIDGTGLVGLPGLVDCHTHTVFAGSRAAEFRRRLSGVPYTQILEEGGGILSTVRATRQATEDELAAIARARVTAMRARGVTTVEIKSGYGLRADDEAKMLRAARRCGDVVRVVTTFLGAHTVPAELRGDRAAYVRDVLEVQLPACAPLADAIDVYCDAGAFTLDESLAILQAGRARGLAVRVHAEQVAFTGIAAAAAGLGALSADHLERLDPEGIAAMAAAGTVAVLLPAAQVYLRDTAPPVPALRAAGVPMAVATDFNPGTSPAPDLWTAATLAVLVQGLTVEEAVLGITRVAARALGRTELGHLSVGACGDLALVAPPPGMPATVDALVQQLGGHTAALVVQDGRVTVDRRADAVRRPAD